jgi:hypothetical protein
MDEGRRINAIAVPPPSVFPKGRPFLGVLMLDTRFPRPPGDIGNPASWGVPTLTRVVRGASAARVVQGAQAQQSEGLLAPFVRTLHELQDDGAAAITTTCGFLVSLQKALQEAARVPVVTSSLLMLPGLLERCSQVGVLTISAESLGEGYFQAAGVPPGRLRDVAVEGVDPQGAFARPILQDHPVIDFAAAAQDVIAAALRLKRRAPGVCELVLECTNMPPYAAAVERATGLKTWSLLQHPDLLAPFGRLRS